MIAFLTFLMIFLALFVNSWWAVVLLVLFILLNIGRLCYAYQNKANDPIEWGKTVFINGGATLILTGLLVWSFLP